MLCPSCGTSLACYAAFKKAMENEWKKIESKEKSHISPNMIPVANRQVYAGEILNKLGLELECCRSYVMTRESMYDYI